MGGFNTHLGGVCGSTLRADEAKMSPVVYTAGLAFSLMAIGRALSPSPSLRTFSFEPCREAGSCRRLGCFSEGTLLSVEMSEGGPCWLPRKGVG